jgi:ubiquinone/menaquinone biosynthesis C-methylase UbiE
MASDGLVYAIDHASGSVAASSARNAELIKQGRVRIQRASVSELPFPDNQFDLVTAMRRNTTGPTCQTTCARFCVLKPGGQLVVIAEYYKGGKYQPCKRVP